MELAIEHVNTRNPSVVPQLADLRPGFHMNYTLLDTQLSAAATVELLMDYLFQSRWLAGDGVQRAVLGPLLSDTAKPAALLAGAEQVPIVSYRASAPELVQLLRLLNPTLTRVLTLTRTLILPCNPNPYPSLTWTRFLTHLLARVSLPYQPNPNPYPNPYPNPTPALTL